MHTVPVTLKPRRSISPTHVPKHIMIPLPCPAWKTIHLMTNAWIIRVATAVA
jgi:hypothetical protein